MLRQLATMTTTTSCSCRSIVIFPSGRFHFVDCKQSIDAFFLYEATNNCSNNNRGEKTSHRTIVHSGSQTIAIREMWNDPTKPKNETKRNIDWMASSVTAPSSHRTFLTLHIVPSCTWYISDTLAHQRIIACGTYIRLLCFVDSILGQ